MREEAPSQLMISLGQAPPGSMFREVEECGYRPTTTSGR
jgi:hypothetical protein